MSRKRSYGRWRQGSLLIVNVYQNGDGTLTWSSTEEFEEVAQKFVPNERDIEFAGMLLAGEQPLRMPLLNPDAADMTDCDVATQLCIEPPFDELLDRIELLSQNFDAKYPSHRASIIRLLEMRNVIEDQAKSVQSIRRELTSLGSSTGAMPGVVEMSKSGGNASSEDVGTNVNRASLSQRRPAKTGLVRRLFDMATLW